MTVRNETADADLVHKFVIVEMLELIGRAAEVKYMGTDQESLSLAQKIELILPDLLALVGKKY